MSEPVYFQCPACGVTSLFSGLVPSRLQKLNKGFRQELLDGDEKRQHTCGRCKVRFWKGVGSQKHGDVRFGILCDACYELGKATMGFESWMQKLNKERS